MFPLWHKINRLKEVDNGPRVQWMAAGGFAILYALATTAPMVVIAAQNSFRALLESLVQLAGATGFAFIGAGATLDFVTGLVESFRSGVEHDHD